VPIPQVLSIVIVSLNAREYLRRCLDSIYTHLAIDFEIAVIDNASRDGSAEMVAREFPEVRLLRNRRNVGYATAANFAADAAAGDVIVFLSPDCELTNDDLSEAADYLRNNPDVGALGISLVDSDGRPQLSVRPFPTFGRPILNRSPFLRRPAPGDIRRRSYRATDWGDAAVVDVDTVVGTCLLTTRAVLDKVGPFDEGFFWGYEDVDFCQRVHQTGLRVVYYRPARIVHATTASADGLPTRAIIARHRGMWRYYKRYQSSRALELPVFVAIWTQCGLKLIGTLPQSLTAMRRH